MRSCVYGNDLIVSMTRGLVKSIPSFVINSVYFRPVIKENLRVRGCALHWRALLEGSEVYSDDIVVSMTGCLVQSSPFFVIDGVNSRPIV